MEPYTCDGDENVIASEQISFAGPAERVLTITSKVNFMLVIWLTVRK